MQDQFPQHWFRHIKNRNGEIGDVETFLLEKNDRLSISYAVMTDK